MNPRRVVTLFALGAITSISLFQALPAFAQEQQPPDDNVALCAQCPDSSSASPQAAPPQSPQTPPPQQPPSTGQSSEEDKSKSQPATNGTSNDRLGFVLPNFLTVENVGKIPPLSAKQKFGAVARGAFDWAQFAWYGFLSGLSQAENSEPGYGQGAQGYGKRYGAAVADGTIENFMVGAVFPSMLRQDPRYYQKGKGGFWRRTGYAVSRVLVTRSDSGSSQVNFSEIFGSALSAGISTYSYHPHADKTVRNTLSVWGTQVGYDSLSYFVKEFWPDIRRWVKKDRSH